MCRSNKIADNVVSPEPNIIDLTPGNHTDHPTAANSTSSNVTRRKFNFLKCRFFKKQTKITPTSPAISNTTTQAPASSERDTGPAVFVTAQPCIPSHSRTITTSTASSDARSNDALLTPTAAQGGGSVSSLHSVNLFSPPPANIQPKRWCLTFGKQKKV